MYKLEESIKIYDTGLVFILKERLQDIVGGYDLDGWEDYSEDKAASLKPGIDTAEVIENVIEETSRWSEHHECIFKLNGKYFVTHYSEGLTEMQDEAPYEYEDDWIEVSEVVPKEVTVVQYVIKERV